MPDRGIYSPVAGGGSPVGGAANLTTVGFIPYVSAVGVLSIQTTVGREMQYDSATGKVAFGRLTSQTSAQFEVGGSSSSTIRVRQSAATPTGFVDMATGSATLSGYFAWYRPNGTRSGFMGNDATIITLNLENSATFNITGGKVIVTGAQAGNPWVSLTGTDSSGGVQSGTLEFVGSTAKIWRAFIGTNGDLQWRDINNSKNIFQLMTGDAVNVGAGNNLTAGTFNVYDATASTGITTSTIQAGAGQSSNDLFRIFANDGSTILAKITSVGYLSCPADITVAVAVASLPAAPVEGMRAAVNNSNAASFTAGIGAVVAAGGTTHVPVYYDGTNWRIG